jgi:HEPN domain-containing protein
VTLKVERIIFLAEGLISMAKNPAEWIKQADYDYDTAELMQQSGRNFYAVFMCHMAIEKGLKALLLLKTCF